MTTGSDIPWPTYGVGPRDFVFALGVVSINYAQLEFALSAMFSTVTGVERSTSAILLPRIRNDVQLSLMKDKLSQRRWPLAVVGRASHFIDGFSICAENRNSLMHSNVFLKDDAIILYKISNSRRNVGKTVSCNPTLAKIRRIADDINAFRSYGLALSNAINFNLFSSNSTEMPWPDKPTLPEKLHYSGKSHAIRGLHDDT